MAETKRKSSGKTGTRSSAKSSASSSRAKKPASNSSAAKKSTAYPAGRNNSGRRPNTKGNVRRSNTARPADNGVRSDVVFCIVLAVSILLFLSNFNLVGSAGRAIGGFIKGVFGVMAYPLPVHPGRRGGNRPLACRSVSSKFCCPQCFHPGCSNSSVSN